MVRMSETTQTQPQGGTVDHRAHRHARARGARRRRALRALRAQGEDLESALSGEPVIALCGKVWVPGRDPKRFPVCPACKEIIDESAFGSGDDDGGE